MLSAINISNININPVANDKNEMLDKNDMISYKDRGLVQDLSEIKQRDSIMFKNQIENSLFKDNDEFKDFKLEDEGEFENRIESKREDQYTESLNISDLSSRDARQLGEIFFQVKLTKINIFLILN